MKLPLTMLLGLGWAAPVMAHHVAPENGLAPVLPRNAVGLQASAATFQHSGSAGHWQSLTHHVEWGPVSWLSVFGALPLARVAVTDAEDATGLGDLSLSARAVVLGRGGEGPALALGLGFELPTGDDEHGLGDGHASLAPFATAGGTLFTGDDSKLMVWGLAALRMALAGSHSHGAGSPTHLDGSALAPHGDREIAGRLMSGLVLGRAHLAAGAEGAVVLTGDAGNHLAARVEGGWTFGRVRAHVGAGATVAGERRYGVCGTAGADVLF